MKTDENFIFQTIYRAIFEPKPARQRILTIPHSVFAFFFFSFFWALFYFKYLWYFDWEDLHCWINFFCASIPLWPPVWIRESLTVLTDSNVSSSMLLPCFPKSSCWWNMLVQGQHFHEVTARSWVLILINGNIQYFQLFLFFPGYIKKSCSGIDFPKTFLNSSLPRLLWTSTASRPVALEPACLLGCKYLDWDCHR